jgi:hypothetical protein
MEKQMPFDIETTARMPDSNILAYFTAGWCKVFEEKECTTCWCKGGTLEGDMQGDGVYATHVEYLTPCSACVEQGLCPGCGNKTIDPARAIADQTCVICDWQYDNDRFYPSEEW